MINSDSTEQEFFSSLATQDNEFQNSDAFYSWFNNKAQKNKFTVEEIPFEQLDNWYFEQGTNNLKHSSGKFFTIEGIYIKTNFGYIQEWQQPVIIQSEIGILGIITKVFKGIRYFLMQAKMEPGNVNIMQLSPTVQATKSNYTKVHQGKLPKYLDYFLDSSKSTILIDQLQTEQGGRFLKKRNRNMVVEVFDNIVVDEDFIWLTWGQIKSALKINNFVNMDSRSVVSTIPFISEDKNFDLKERRNYMDVIDSIGNTYPNGKLFFESAIHSKDSAMSFNQVLSWITEMKTRYELSVDRIPLSKVNGWVFNDFSIKHESKPFFSVIAVKVQARNREVIEWSQPLLKDTNFGLIGYIVKKINGLLHFLVQAKVEAGSFDIVDLAPTVSCSNYYQILKSSEKPPFIDFFDKPRTGSVLFSTIQSEEGGRFFHFQNLNMIILADENEIKQIPDNYKWLTLSQLMRLIKYGLLNIESRSLISGISLF